MLDALLEDEVAEVALDDLVKARRTAKLLHNLVLQLQWSSVNAGLNQLRGELVQRQSLEVSDHLIIYALAHLEIVKVDDLLYHEVAELVLDILERVNDDVLDNAPLLQHVVPRVLDDLLHDAQAVLVLGQFLEVGADVVEDLLADGLWVARDDQIDHMVALLVLGQP